VLKMVLKGKYYYHLFQQHYNEVLQQDCQSEALRRKLRVKAIYHSSMVVEVGSKI